MYKAKDGKEFAHEGMGKSYDGALGAGKGGLKPSAPAGKEGEQPAHEVVAQHGPAHTTQIVKDKKTGSHSVHSHHEDGHKHSSHGHNIESAHSESMELHGGGEEAQGNEPGAEPNSEAPESPASGM
jgi:hypothetical protein